MDSKLGFTVVDIRPVLNGLGLFDRYGMDIDDSIIELSIRSAEDRVERDLDLLITPRIIHCVQDQTEPEDPADTRIIKPPLTKPVNWFQGHRQGAIKLPIGPARRVTRVTLKPFGPLARDFDIDPDRFRLERNLLRFVPGPLGSIFPLGSIPISSMLVHDGYAIPAGVEVVYEAGLTARQLHQDYAQIPSLVRLATLLELLILFQARIGGGIQAEQLQQDNLGNKIDYGKRDAYGPLGGEIKAMEAQYQRLVTNVRSMLLTFWYFQ